MAHSLAADRRSAGGCRLNGSADTTRRPRLISHTFVGIKDVEKALPFYAALMEALGNTLRFCDRERPWAGWQSPSAPRPLFLIGRPYDRDPHAAGNGQMVALLAPSRDAVRNAYQLALLHGGTSEGGPALRPEYHAHYYGAYFRDPDGNKLCVVCHDAEDPVEPHSGAS